MVSCSRSVVSVLPTLSGAWGVMLCVCVFCLFCFVLFCFFGKSVFGVDKRSLALLFVPPWPLQRSSPSTFDVTSFSFPFLPSRMREWPKVNKSRDSCLTHAGGGGLVRVCQAVRICSRALAVCPLSPFFRCLRRFDKKPAPSSFFFFILRDLPFS